MRFIKATIAGGFFVLLPVKELGGVAIARVVAVVAILLVCFLTGAIMETRVGAAVGGWFRRALLERIPGYTLIRSLTLRFSGAAEDTQFAPAMIDTSPGVQEIAFIIEEHDNGSSTLFVPLAPTPTIGSVRHVDREHVTRANASMGTVINCVMQWGVGANEILKQHEGGEGLTS